MTMRTAGLILIVALGLLVSNCGTGFEDAVEDSKTGSIFAPRHRARQAPMPQAEANQNNYPVVSQSGVPLPAPVYIPQPQDVMSPSNMPQALGTLFVLVSGNSTCNRSVLGDRMPGLVETSLFDGFITWMMNTGYVQQNDNIIFACYETLSPQMQVYDVKYRPQMVSIHESELEGIVFAQAHQAQRIIILGHSYGGWKSMKMASSPQLLNYTRAPIELVTVDPISKINCTNPLMPGCRQAPSDFTDVEFATLNQRTRWMNAVQEPGVILGSDSMPAAHVNLKFTGVNHFTIVSDQRLWEAITNFIPRL